MYVLPEFSKYDGRPLTRVMRDFTNVAQTTLNSYRLLPATELVYTGIGGSNQIDKLRGLLKSQPKKLAFKKNTVDAIPPLYCVTTTQDDLDVAAASDDEVRRRKAKLKQRDAGYCAGDEPFGSLAMKTNVVACKDYEHAKFIQLKGKDFKFVLSFS